MTYVKHLLDSQSLKEDSWYQWLNLWAIDSLEYSIDLRDNQLSLEFFDWERAQEFAQEFGL
jgi:hypothetical protein